MYNQKSEEWLSLETSEQKREHEVPGGLDTEVWGLRTHWSSFALFTEVSAVVLGKGLV